MKVEIDKLLESFSFTEAERLIASEVQKNSDIFDLLHLYVLTFQRQKKWTAVAQVLEILIFFGEKTAENYSALIQSYRNSGNLDGADLIARNAIDIFPGNLSLQSEYSWTAQVREDWAEAVTRLELLNKLAGSPASGRVVQRLLDARTKNSSYLSKEKIENAIDDGVSEPFDLVLTTFPNHKSRNVGDNLICHSAVQMIKSRNISFEPRFLFREAALDGYQDQSIRKIIAPGFSVSEGVYPNLFKLYKNLDRLPLFFPVGCSFQSSIPSLKAFDEKLYSKETLNFLKFIVDRSGPLPCRDNLIVDMLHRSGVAAVYSGDMAIYAESNIGVNFNPPSAVKSVVFTIQHSNRYDEQSINLINLIKRSFRDSKLYVAFHSKPSINSQKIANHAVESGFHALHLYGDVSNLDVYDEIDLHIGYRLHGHISFLRRRKPSVLMIEDARSLGFAKTFGTSLGCFEALSAQGNFAEDNAPAKAMAFVGDQMKINFSDYQSVFSFIDLTYRDFVEPFFNRLAKSV